MMENYCSAQEERYFQNTVLNTPPRQYNDCSANVRRSQAPQY
jgi:hypothetical protein